MTGWMHNIFDKEYAVKATSRQRSADRLHAAGYTQFGEAAPRRRHGGLAASDRAGHLPIRRGSRTALMTRCEGAVTQLGGDWSTFASSDATRGCGRIRDVLLDLTFQTRLPTADQMNDIAAVMEDLHELMPFGRCAR